MAHKNNPNTNPDLHNDLPIPDELEITYSVVFILGTIVVGLFGIIHFYNTYSDIFTTARKSLSHRRKLPVIDVWYKWVSFFTLVMIWSNCFSLLFFSVAFTSTHFCYENEVFGVTFYFMAKGTMYSVFFIRLHQVYGESAYGYNKKLIIALIIIVNLITVAIVVMFVETRYTIIWYYDNDGKIPEYCIGISPYVNFVGIGQDVIFTIGSMIAFLVPLRRTIKMMGDNINEKVEAKMVFIGTKLAILSITATVSTVIFLALIAFTNSTLFQAVDEAVNSLCLMFMTSYYPDNKYYQRYCCLCIACCDRKHRSYESKASDDNRQADKEHTVDPSSIQSSQTEQTNTVNASAVSSAVSSASSADTVDQIEIVVKQTNQNGQLL